MVKSTLGKLVFATLLVIIWEIVALWGFCGGFAVVVRDKELSSLICFSVCII